MEDFRNRLAKKELTIQSLSEATQFDGHTYRSRDCEIYCPSCFHTYVRQSFVQNERLTCVGCDLPLRFIVWAKTRDGNAWKAGLMSIS